MVTFDEIEAIFEDYSKRNGFEACEVRGGLKKKNVRWMRGLNWIDFTVDDGYLSGMTASMVDEVANKVFSEIKGYESRQYSQELQEYIEAHREAVACPE